MTPLEISLNAVVPPDSLRYFPLMVPSNIAASFNRANILGSAGRETGRNPLVLQLVNRSRERASGEAETFSQEDIIRLPDVSIDPDLQEMTLLYLLCKNTASGVPNGASVTSIVLWSE